MRELTPEEQAYQEIGKYREKLAAALGVLKAGLSLPERAQHIHAREDAEVLDLCERNGYGAVMDSASRQWFLKVGGGALVVGTAHTLLANAIRTIKEMGDV